MIGDYCLSCGKKWRRCWLQDGKVNYICENEHNWTEGVASSLQEYEDTINKLEAKIAGLEAQVQCLEEQKDWWMNRND